MHQENVKILPSKIVFGIRIDGTIIDGFKDQASPYEQYLFEIWKHDNGYKFEVETLIGFNEKNGCIDYMNRILLEVEKWMKMHEFDINKELNVYEVFTKGVNANTTMRTIEDCYALLKFLIRGFKGQGIL
jgi:hypothetical protein